MIFGLKNKRSERQGGADSLFALPGAEITLETKFGIHSTGKAALCLHDTDGIEFSNLIEDTKKFLERSGAESNVAYQVSRDSFGYIWIVLHGQKIEDLVATVNAVGEDVAERGYSSQILAYVFEFKSENGPDMLYLIYNQKQGLFYPFVPLRNQTRNTEVELKVFAVMKDELPMQKKFELWYPMWDMPLRN